MRLLRVSALVLFVLGAPSMASAQDTITLPKGNISFFGAFTATAADGLESGHGFGLSGTYFFTDMIGVEGGYRRQGFDISTTDENNLSNGELNANVITANVVFRATSGRVQPYGTAGIAFYIADYVLDPAIAGQFNEFSFTSGQSVENTVGFNFGGGMDFQATQRLGFFVEGRVIIATADTNGELIDINTQISGATPGEQELNYVAINGGIRIFF